MAPLAGRIYLGNRKGRGTFTVNWPGVINFRSVVAITASEYWPFQIETGPRVPGVPVPFPPTDDYRRFVGAADIFVSGISPHGPGGTDPGGVTFALNVNWRDPIPVVCDIIVFDPPVDRIMPR